jgi:hypothetical protein
MNINENNLQTYNFSTSSTQSIPIPNPYKISKSQNQLPQQVKNMYDNNNMRLISQLPSHINNYTSFSFPTVFSIPFYHQSLSYPLYNPSPTPPFNKQHTYIHHSSSSYPMFYSLPPSSLDIHHYPSSSSSSPSSSSSSCSSLNRHVVRMTAHV